MKKNEFVLVMACHFCTGVINIDDASICCVHSASWLENLLYNYIGPI